MVADKLQAALRERCTDPDEKVRAAACKLFGEIDYETALHFVSLETLKAVAGRLADKKVSSRERSKLTLVVCTRRSFWCPQALVLTCVL